MFQKNKIGIIRVEPLNFSIRNEQNKAVIISRFQQFLNSLDFPIQILISSNQLNLDTYISKMEERVESLTKKNSSNILPKHLNSYKEHLLATIKKHSVLDRTFDIVIAETTSLEVQMGVCLDQLKALNLKARTLNDDEIVQSLSSCFNDVLEDNDKSKYLSEELTKENYLHSLIAPPFIKNNPDYILVNNNFCKVIYADGYPRKVEPGFLDKIITLNGIFDISIFIEPIAIEDMMIMLNKELQKQSADLYASQMKSILNPSLEIQYNDTKSILEQLQKGNEKLFYVSLYINCKAQSKEELELITRKVEAELNSMLIIPKRANFRMKEGLKSTIPLIDNQLQIKRNIQTSALSAFFPFTSKFLQLDESGVWIGLNKNDVPLIRDIFKLTNPNGLILASSGSGKSYFTKLFIIRQILNSTKVMVIDPQSEYLNLLKQFDGDIVNFSRTSKTVINPLDLMGHDYADKRLSLLDLFNIMLGNLSEIQKAVLDKALTKTYERKGITANKKTWNNEPPILGDLYNELEKMSKSATIVERETYRSLLNRISVYVDGVFSYFNRQTNIKFRDNFVGFVIGDMPKQAKPINMFLILDYVYMHMKKDLKRKLLVIDEAWSLLSRAEDSEYIFEIVKTCRKFNLGLLLITQDVADLLSSRASAAILQNSSYKLLMKQEAAVIENVGMTFGLSMVEKEKLLTANVGEGILLMDNDHTEIRSIASDKEHEIITTNADEILKTKDKEKDDEPIKEDKKKVNIKIDESKGYFRKSDISDDEIEFLLQKKYIPSSHVPLGGGRQMPYFLKPSKRETPTHFFLVKALEEYVSNYSKNVKIFETAKPDVVFKAGKKKIAIEVETGVLAKDSKRLTEKIKLLKKYDDWFFVVAHAPDAYKYERYGKVFTRKNVCSVIRSYFKSL